ncbi:hypothetical protein KVF89_22495 [Nocardioides carbamazepini]|uniref:hypothetical protein n=1 Tax=Nocardioides carbamazepini TaxID=2854259 RepID=UPI00214A7C07|nr:hypothetical protein [Nocardioides carbamazepini]MCR1785327.1 hypothetical protein [Nocardioides carbamazepini]
MAEQDDRDTLAEVIAGEDKPCRKALASHPGGCVGEYGWCLCRKTADAILTSDWLAQHDRTVRAEELRKAADEMKGTIADLRATGGAELSYVNCTLIDVRMLRERADRIESETKEADRG